MARTREEKVKRLQELISVKYPVSWLKMAERCDSLEDFLDWYDHENDIEPANKTWDVHTEVAFTKLYRMLK